MTEPQPLDLTAFLATAEYAITQAPKDVTDGTGENLRSAGTHYAPRLLAALKVALAFHVHAVIEDMPDPFHYCKTCSGHPAWPCREVQAITRELLGKGE